MGPRLQPQALESRLLQHPGVQSRHRIDSYAKKPVRPSLVVRNCAQRDLHHIQQVILVANARKFVLLLVRSQIRKIIDRFRFEPQNISLYSWRERRLCQESFPFLRPAFPRSASWRMRDQAVGTKRLLVKEDCVPKFFVNVSTVALSGETGWIDSQFIPRSEERRVGKEC